MALAPNLYHGAVATESDDAQKLAMAPKPDQAMRDIEQAATALTGMAAVELKQVGVVGFCMGGRLALFFGATSGLAGAISAFYHGHYKPSPEQALALQAPALIHFGAAGERRASLGGGWEVR